MSNDPSIEVLTQRLAQADIDPQLRDQLSSDLDWAVLINGNPDPSMQGIKRLVVCGIRRELLAFDREHKTRLVIDRIMARCSEMHGEAQAEESGEHAGVARRRIDVFMTVVRALTPWRWPLALAACSPWSVGLVQAIAAAFAK